MAIRIGSNIAALQVQRRLDATSSDLASAFERLSSGLRINRASDDAAGLAIASNIGVDRRVFTQGIRNLNDGLSLLSVADGAVGQLSNIVIRQRELAEQAANGTLSDTQRSALDDEAQALFEEYARILNTTEFNGQNLLNGTFGQIALQAGYGSDGSLEAVIREGYTQEGGAAVGLGTYTNYNRGFGLGFPPEGSVEFIVDDFNNDGIDDIFAVKATDAGAAVRFDAAIFVGEDGGTSFSPPVTTSFDAVYTGTLQGVSFAGAVADRGGDGDLDIDFGYTVSASLGGQLGRVFFVNDLNPGGSLALSVANNGVGNPVNQLQTTVTGDFNNDGVQDEVNSNVGGSINIRIQDTELTGDAFIGDSLEQTSFSLISAAFARNALDSLEENLTLLTEVRASIGASQSRIFSSTNVLSTATENLAAAQSQIEDVDVAFESARLLRNNILQQASASILAQANLQPAIALSLLS